MIGIIGAMAVEVEGIVSRLAEKKRQDLSGVSFYEGKLASVSCVVAQCGPGKVNAALCAEAMILNYSPKLIINIGVAGGIGKDVRIGDIVVASACVQHDYDTSPLGDERSAVSCLTGGEIKEFSCDENAASALVETANELYPGVHRGIVATGDSFIANPEKCRELDRDFGAVACEMEGGAIAQVCRLNGVPCAVLRAISDNADDDGKVNFLVFAADSAKKCAELLEKAMPRL